MGLVTDLIREHIENKHAQDNAAELQQRNLYSGILFNNLPADNGGYTDEQKEYAAGKLKSLLGPSAKKSLDKAIPLYQTLQKLASPQTQVPQSADTATIAPPPGGGPLMTQPPAKLASPTTPIPRPASEYPFSTQADIQGAHDAAQQRQYNFWLERGKQVLGPDANPRDLAEYAGSQGQRLPSQQKRVSDKGVARPGIDPATGQQYTGLWDHVVEPDGTESWAKRDEKLVNQQKEWVHYPGEPDDALHEVWADPRHPGKRVDENGKPVPDGATSVNPSVAAAKIRGMFWGRFGQEYQAALAQGHPEEEAKRIAGQKTDAYLDKQFGLMGATRIHEALGIDAEGNSVAVPLQSSVVPSSGPPAAAPPSSGEAPAPPASTAPSASVPPAAPGSVIKAPPVAAPKTGLPGSTPAPVAPPRTGGPLANRQLDAVSPAQARQAAQFAIPITESVVQMFGDPAQPDIKPLSGFAHLADDPKAAARIGKAIELTMSGFGDGIGSAAIGAGAGPIHISAGGFGDWLQNALNVPGAVAQQKADILRKTIQDMTPEEREAYNATMSELSVMAGLRSLNKASAAQGSIRLIENEIPKIGVNVANSKQFYDQLQKIAGAISNAMNTPGAVPKVKDVPYGVTPEMFSRIKGLSAEMQRKKDAAGVSPRGRGALKSPGSAPSNADQYLKSIGVQ